MHNRMDLCQGTKLKVWGIGATRNHGASRKAVECGVGWDLSN